MIAQPPGILKRLYDAVAMVAVVNAFVLIGFAAYLYGTGALDVKKLRQIGMVVRGIPLTAAKPVGPAPSPGAIAQPSAAPAETDQEVEMAYRESERIKTELEQRLALSNSILLKVRTEREAFQKEREAAQKKEEAAKVAQQDQGFRRQAEILEALAPKVAVQHLLSMADTDEAARLLMTMDTARVKKIVEAAKRGDEVTRMKAILQRVREVAPMQLADFSEGQR